MDLPPPPALSNGLSAEARSFMEQSLGASWATIDLAEVGALRRENSQVALEGWEHCKSEDECLVGTREESFASVNVLWVTPRKGVSCKDAVCLYLFGGGFIVGRPEDDLSMISRISCLTGMAVCAPRYRLAPEHPFPAARQDVESVCDYLSEQGQQLVIVGESAGGNLALSLVLRLCNQQRPPRAVVLFSPWIDLTQSGDSASFGLDPTLSKDHFLVPASIAYAGNTNRTSPEISPLFSEFPLTFPPTLISTATRDLLLSDCVRLANKLHGKGCSVKLMVAEGLFHVYEWYPKFPEARQSLRQVSQWIVSVL